MNHRVRVERQSLGFAAAHMATFGGELEPLHGHSYAVTVEVQGRLAPDSWVIDFGDVKAICRSVCKELDHRFLLQEESRLLKVSRSPGLVEIKFAERSYTLPERDVVSLPLDNTTAERLAEWFAGRISDRLAEMGTSNVTSITVGVEESPGQSGWFTLEVG